MHSSAAGKLREGGLLQLDTIQDFLYKLGKKLLKHLKSVHFKNTVVGSSVLFTKIMIILNNTSADFVLISGCIVENDHKFDRTEDHTTVF